MFPMAIALSITLRLGKKKQLLLFLCVYWQTANQLCVYHHPLYRTLYIRKHAQAQNEVIVPNVKTP